MINNLSLEELIAAKLELSMKTCGSPLYGLPIYKHLPEIVEDAVLKFTISISRTLPDAAAFLGMTPYKFIKLIKKYQLFKYFNPTYDKLVKEKIERLKGEAANGSEIKSNEGTSTS